MSKGTDRMYERKWGVFNHYLCDGKCDWNERVNGIDVELIAKQLHEVGAKYYSITTMQCTPYMIAPNATFDKIAGSKPGEWCATRDVIMELADELEKYDIDLYLYFTGDGPSRKDERYDAVNVNFWGDEYYNADKKVHYDFVSKWASVLEEYAVRYGSKVKGWWIDGCYKDVLGYTDELLELYSKAAKKGNPDAIVAMNGGSRPDFHKNYIGEDFTCGEFIDFVEVPESRYVEGAQAHRLAPLGGNPWGNLWPTWCVKGLKHTKEYMLDYVRAANEAGAVVSIVFFVDKDGRFDFDQMYLLKYLSENL